MGARTLAFRTNKKMIEAEALLEMLARTYPIFTKWREDIVDTAMLRGYIATNYGWRLHVTAGTKPTALKNFPMQSHGAEMLRIACCLAVERGVKVIAPVHDAIMIEATTEMIDDAIVITKGAMAEAAVKVIGSSIWIDVDVQVTSYPNRYRDKDGRGLVMWERVMSLLGGLDKPMGVSGLSGVSI